MSCAVPPAAYRTACLQGRGLLRIGLLAMFVAAHCPAFAIAQEKRDSTAADKDDKDDSAPVVDPLFDSVAAHRKSRRLANILNLTFTDGLIRLNEEHWKQQSLTLPEDPSAARNRDMQKRFGGAIKMTFAVSPTIRLMNKLFEGEQVTERTTTPSINGRRATHGLATKGLYFGHETNKSDHELRLQTDDLELKIMQRDMMLVLSLTRTNGDVLLLNSTLNRSTIMRSDARGNKTATGSTLYEMYEKDPQFVRATIDGLAHLGIGGPLVRIFDPEMRRQVVKALRPKIKSNMDFVEVVSQLGSDEFKVREAATKMLRQHAGEFRDQLEKEADNEDNEIELRNRLDRVITEWDLSKTLDVQFAEALANDADFLVFARKSADDSEKSLIDKRLSSLEALQTVPGSAADSDTDNKQESKPTSKQ